MFVSFFLFLRCGNFRLSWVVNVPDFRHYRYLGQALLKVCACFCVSTYSHIHGCNQFCHPEQKAAKTLCPWPLQLSESPVLGDC